MFELRNYQKPVMKRNGPGVLVLHWARQIGKSYALASWAVDRLLTCRNGHLVTVLSNSRENGAEFLLKCAEVCRKMDLKFGVRSAECGMVSKGEDGGLRREEGKRENIEHPTLNAELPSNAENRTGKVSWRGIIRAENFRMEMRITHKGKTGRIKVLAANPRTARGFSGDLILDEFAFHEDSAAIWEAAEPILASNPDFRCRIASTGNGKHNMFYRMVAGVCRDVPLEHLNDDMKGDGGEGEVPAEGFNDGVKGDAPAEGVTKLDGKDLGTAGCSQKV